VLEGKAYADRGEFTKEEDVTPDWSRCSAP